MGQSKRYWILGALAVMSALLAYLGRGRWFFDAFAANVSAGFIGALATAVLIERAAEARAAADRKRIERLALVRMRRPLNRLLTLLAAMIKAARPAAEASAPKTIAELMSPARLSNLDWLDLSSECGRIDKGDWYVRLASEIQEMREGISSTLDRYVVFLDPEFVETFDALTRDSFLTLLGGLKRSREALLRGGHNQPATLNGTAALREEAAKSVLAAVNLFVARTGDELEVPPVYHREDLGPKTASSRAKELLRPLIVRNGPPLPEDSEIRHGAV